VAITSTIFELSWTERMTDTRNSNMVGSAQSRLGIDSSSPTVISKTTRLGCRGWHLFAVSSSWWYFYCRMTNYKLLCWLVKTRSH